MNVLGQRLLRRCRAPRRPYEARPRSTSKLHGTVTEREATRKSPDGAFQGKLFDRGGLPRVSLWRKEEVRTIQSAPFGRCGGDFLSGERLIQINSFFYTWYLVAITRVFIIMSRVYGVNI